MPKLKPFLNYQEQINNLITKKGLIINNPSSAEKKLQEIRYYALIDGYKSIFYDYTSRTYLLGTTFEDIVNLYDFDEELRLLIFKYICHVEQRIRSQISYYFCDKYSSNQNVPLWTVINTLTLGQVSKMYSFMQSDIQSKISHCYEAVNERELGQHLKVITDFRNVCAHNEHLFLYHSHTDIPDTVLHKKLCIPKIGSSYAVGKNDLFAIVIALRYLLPKNDFKLFYKRLKYIIMTYQKNSSQSNTEKLLDSMGFHSTWKSILRYKP